MPAGAGAGGCAAGTGCPPLTGRTASSRFHM